MRLATQQVLTDGLDVLIPLHVVRPLERAVSIIEAFVSFPMLVHYRRAPMQAVARARSSAMA